MPNPGLLDPTLWLTGSHPSYKFDIAWLFSSPCLHPTSLFLTSPNTWGTDYSEGLPFSCTSGIITLCYIKELDDKGGLIGEGYWNYGVTDKECDKMGEMCDPYEDL